MALLGCPRFGAIGVPVHNKSTIKTSDLIEASSMLAYDEEDNDGEGLDYIIKINMETEFQISRRIVELCRYLSCYNISTRQWFYFDGIRWCKDSKNNIYAHVSENFAKAIVETSIRLLHTSITDNAKKSAASCASLFKKKTYIDSLIAQAAVGEDGLGVSGEAFDSELMYIGAKNGVINLKTGELIESGYEGLYITKSTGFSYDENSENPKDFFEFLLSVFPDITGQKMKKKEEYLNEIDAQNWPESVQTAAYESYVDNYKYFLEEQSWLMIDFLQVLFGYILTGLTCEHLFLILYGPEGRNGKGILVRTIMKVFGDYGGEVRPELFTKSTVQSSSSASPEILDLKGKRFVCASEANQGEQFDTGVVKRLSGGDEMVGRALYGQDYIRFKSTFTPTLQSNFLPSAASNDSAFYKRVIIIPFIKVFLENPDENDPLQGKIDKGLEQKLEAEGSQILKWVVDGALLYQKNGLQIPDFLTRVRDTTRKDADVIGAFIDECCVVKDGLSIEMKKFVCGLSVWGKFNKINTPNNKRIVMELEQRGIVKKKSSTTKFFGIDFNNAGKDYVESPDYPYVFPSTR